MIAPDLFELDDVDGHTSAANDDLPDELGETVREAVHSCPEQAIVVLADQEAHR
jgi:ferredoxin